MARLIDADALPRHGRRGGLVHWKDIENAPTIDAEPVKHGHWEVVDGAEPRRWGCSNCRCLSWHEFYYCPNCGAKMDEDEYQEPEINPCSGCGDYDGRGGRMRLIDADELKHDLEWLECDTPVYLDVMSTIDERTTVDAVEVVRCKDCECWGLNRTWLKDGEVYMQDCFVNQMMTKPDFFCAGGEKRAEKE